MAYNDTYMRYDFDRHRYVLTADYVTERLNIDLLARINATGAIDRAQAVVLLLERASQNVYTWIYENGGDNTAQEYILGTDEQARRMLMDAMGEQVLYILANGDLGLTSGLDGSTMSGVGQAAFVEARVAPNAKAILTRNLTAYECPVTFFGRFPIPHGKRSALPTYEEDQY
jgi:hypothetical protein